MHSIQHKNIVYQRRVTVEKKPHSGDTDFWSKSKRIILSAKPVYFHFTQKRQEVPNPTAKFKVANEHFR